MVQYVIKRDGRKVKFDKSKIYNAIMKAFKDVYNEVYDEDKVIAGTISNYVGALELNELSVENIQDIVEEKLMDNRKDVAKAYIIYRNKRSEIRGNLIDNTVLEYLNGNNEYWNTENSNKNPKIVSVQRDYMAGIISTDIARRILLPKEVCEAHDLGIIHQHDMDYLAQMALSNCCLMNLDDMLQNGTIVNGVRIDKPKRLLTATTIATQLATAVNSSQYGGNSLSLTHLAPFVKDSYNEYIKIYKKRGLPEKQIKQFAEEDLKKEIRDSVQTFNYQINSMFTVNGQAPFLTVFMYVNENPKYEKETAMLIEEFLKQRILGMKNEKGVYITPAFPKLIYVLEEDNIHEDSKYWYLTKLAAKCTAKRLVPDYISAKIMKQLKGDVYTCMGKRKL